MRVPPGGIIIWSGLVVNIPPGFVLCDGTLGTPDLRDRFVVGAGASYAVDATGGNLTHDHTFTSDGHDHVIPVGGAIGAGVDYLDNTASDVDTGTTNSVNHLPPYYSLCFIMKT